MNDLLTSRNKMFVKLADQIPADKKKVEFYSRATEV